MLQHAAEAERIVFVTEAEETIKGQPLTLEQRYAVASRQAEKGFRDDEDGVPESMDMVIGMKVMVTQNVETDSDITNGARGTIVDMRLLHPDEPLITRLKPKVYLNHLPYVC